MILWRRQDIPGHEIAELSRRGERWLIEGIVLCSSEGRPCRLDYEVSCDASWHTRATVVRGRVGAQRVSLEIVRSAEGEWIANGAPQPSLRGCTDVDLGFSPSTNLLPIRRLALSIGERADVSAAWMRFPELTLEVLDQTYSRLSETTYLYESANGAFRRELEVDADGFVIDYPGLWRREATSTIAPP